MQDVMGMFTNPWMMGQLLTNPEAAGQLFDWAGIKPPGTEGANVGMPGQIEGLQTATPGSTLDTGGFGSMLTGLGFSPQAAPGMEAGAAPAGGPAAAQARQVPPQVKGPEPIKPIMSGGVAGGVPPPKSDTNFSGMGPAIALLQQLMQGAGNRNPLRVPQLGALLGGQG